MSAVNFALSSVLPINTIRMASALVLVVALNLLLVGQAHAEDDQSFVRLSGSPATLSLHRSFNRRVVQNQILNGDFTVKSGESVSSNVTVYDGNVKVESEGRIDGNLVVYSGDIEIEEAGVVEGDVSAFSGDIELAGTVGGNVASWSGDVDLDATANIGGDISVLSGNIGRADGAVVGGNLVRGPTLNFAVPAWSAPFQFDGNPDAAGSDIDLQAGNGRTSFLDRVGRFFLNLMLAALLALLFVPLAAALTFAKPGYVDGVVETMWTQPALSFITGLIATLVLAFISICGIPLLLLIGLNFVGWTALSLALGRRLAVGVRAAWSPVLSTIAGAILLSILLVPLWSLGGCFRFIVMVSTFLVGAIGVGGVVLPWLQRARNGHSRQLPAESTAVTPVASSESMSTGRTAVVHGADDGLLRGAEVDVIDRDENDEIEDDFTRLVGVGQVLDAQFKVAGIRTFAQLASLSPDEIAEIVGWSVEQVVDAEFIEQAAEFAQQTD